MEGIGQKPGPRQIPLLDTPPFIDILRRSVPGREGLNARLAVVFGLFCQNNNLF